ncbi:TetR family transcriptional regulator [Ralstonia pseudosolanacearum]
MIEAAIEVVSERGIRTATLADVAARAGVTRGAVYGHFPGKPALVAAIIDGLLWPLDIGDDLAGYRAHPRPLRRLHAQLSAQLTRCLQTPAQRHVVTLVLRESGYLACPDLEPEAAARCLHALGIGILSEHASRRARGAQIEIRQCLRLFFEGIERAAAGSSNLPARRSPAACPMPPGPSRPSRTALPCPGRMPPKRADRRANRPVPPIAGPRAR